MNFYGGTFFGGGFFGEIGGDGHTGGKGDNATGVYKPTGIGPRRKLTAKSKVVQQRLDQSVQIEAEVAGKLARELESDRLGRERSESQTKEARAVIDQEIARLLQIQLRTQEEETLLVLLLAAAVI